MADSGDADFDRARTLLADKREDEALDRFELASEHATDRAVRVSASAHIAALLLGFRRPWEVAEFTGRMRRDRGDEALAALLDASACVHSVTQLARSSSPASPVPWPRRVTLGSRVHRQRCGPCGFAAPRGRPRRRCDRSVADRTHGDTAGLAAVGGDGHARCGWRARSRRGDRPSRTQCDCRHVRMDCGRTGRRHRCARRGALGAATRRPGGARRGDTLRVAARRRRRAPVELAPRVDRCIGVLTRSRTRRAPPAYLLSIGWWRRWSRRRSTPTGREPRWRAPCRCSPTTI